MFQRQRQFIRQFRKFLHLRDNGLTIDAFGQPVWMKRTGEYTSEFCCTGENPCELHKKFELTCGE